MRPTFWPSRKVLVLTLFVSWFVLWKIKMEILSICLLSCSCSVMSNSLRPNGLQHDRLPCPPPYPKFVQSHVHWVGNAIQPSHPLWSLSPPALNLFQHQGLFQWVSDAIQPSHPLWSPSLRNVNVRVYTQEMSFQRGLLPLLPVHLRMKSQEMAFWMISTRIPRHCSGFLEL